MIDDYIVEPRSAEKIEEIAVAWRYTLGAPNEWAPDIINLIENRLPRVLRDFALVVRPDSEMGDAEAFTEFNPPQIVVRESVYLSAARGDGRSRMTLAHELGHLLMHGGAHAKARMAGGNTHAPTAKPYERAEWQANKFASSFLMPTHVVRDFVSAMDLADSCLVSLQAAAIRIEQVGRILKKPLPTCVQDAIKVLEGVSEQPKPR